MVRGLEIKFYKKQLKKLGIFGLKKERLRGDRIAIFLYMKR